MTILYIAIEIIGGAFTYGLCWYYYGKPNGREKAWWNWEDGPAPFFVVVFWFITLPFILAANIGFKKRMTAIEAAKRPAISSNDIPEYRAGLWKKEKEQN